MPQSGAFNQKFPLKPWLFSHVGVFFFSLTLTRSSKVFSPPSCLHQGSLWSHCLNDEVLRLGLARTAPIVGLLPDSHLYWRLHKRLHRAEVRAERKGRGLWKQAGLWERVSEAVGDSAFFRLLRRTFKRTWCKKLLKPCQDVKNKTKTNSKYVKTLPCFAIFFSHFFSHNCPYWICCEVFFPVQLYLTFSWGFQLIHGL